VRGWCASFGVSAILTFMLVRWVLFPRSVLRPRLDAGASVRGLEKLSLSTREGPVEAWFLPADHDGSQPPAPVVVFAHGNGELIEDWPEALEPYRRMGLHVLLPEYRGYGNSAGSPSELAIVEDYIRFYDLVRGRVDVDATRIVLHGRSLGGGVVCALARERPAAALVLESTFTSVPDVAKKWFVPGRLIRDRFDSQAVVRALDVPILVVHGTCDRVVPYEHGVALARAGKRARLVSYECDHNDLPRKTDGFWTEIHRFLTEEGLAPRSEVPNGLAAH
jgi:pimeloyl-ACP methyl ester carboxylesterase